MPWLNRAASKDYPWVSWIHPLKQRSVEVLVEQLKIVSGITYAVVFGSSTRDCCTPTSDVDVVIFCDSLSYRYKMEFTPPDGEEYHILYARDIPWNADLWDEIRASGVVVYES